MTRQTPDPFDALRAADPVHGAPASSDSKARVWARVQEDTMNTPSPTQRRRFSWILGFGTVALASLAVLALVLQGPATPAPSQAPVAGGGDGGGGGDGAAGICLAYSVEELAMRDFAFDGTVTGIDGDQVTFSVNESFIGDLSGSVVLTATTSTEDTTFEGGVDLVEGERYLASGDDGFVWGCGFTQLYSESLAAEWATAG